jgi:outer membrane biogenesis lipoprotein LolB
MVRIRVHSAARAVDLAALLAALVLAGCGARTGLRDGEDVHPPTSDRTAFWLQSHNAYTTFAMGSAG